MTLGEVFMRKRHFRRYVLYQAENGLAQRIRRVNSTLDVPKVSDRMKPTRLDGNGLKARVLEMRNRFTSRLRQLMFDSLSPRCNSCNRGKRIGLHTRLLLILMKHEHRLIRLCQLIRSVLPQSIAVRYLLRSLCEWSDGMNLRSQIAAAEGRFRPLDRI